MRAVDYKDVSTNWLVYGVWFPTQTTVNVGAVSTPVEETALLPFNVMEVPAV